MIIQLAILSLLALACTGQDQCGEGSSMLYDMYLNWCNLANPDNQNVQPDYHNITYACFYFCGGTDADGKDFMGIYSKPDGLRCTQTPWSKEDATCLARSCVPSSSLQACKNALDEKVFAVIGNQCKLTCYGEGGQIKEVQKPEGTSCLFETDSSRPASCTANGHCRRTMNNIPVPKGKTSVDDKIAKAECQRRHDGSALGSHRTKDNNGCEHVCMFNTTDRMPYEYLTFQNGLSCADEKKCLAGECHYTDAIKKCSDVLHEPVEEITIEECTQTCFGKTKVRTVPLEPNAACIKLLNGWDPRDGKCNEDAQCVI